MPGFYPKMDFSEVELLLLTAFINSDSKLVTPHLIPQIQNRYTPQEINKALIRLGRNDLITFGIPYKLTEKGKYYSRLNND
jgi:hypothetical protein